MITNTLVVNSMSGVMPPRTLEATWSIFDSEPGMDDLATKCEDVLNKLGADLQIFPFQDKQRDDRLFLARFEFPKYGEDFNFPAATTAEGAVEIRGFIDFLGGFPIDCVEMFVVIGEISSKDKGGGASKVSVQPGKGVTAPVPAGRSRFFKWPEKDKILLNLTALPTKNFYSHIFAKNLAGEPKPAKLHWWLRILCSTSTGPMPQKFPVPGEFLGLGVRMMPGKYWGHQKSSPFIYSGNFMDTIYYTGAKITSVIDPTTQKPYATYMVEWRKEEVEAVPTDFAEYRVDDRVTILKDIAAEKTTQLWKDDDMKSPFGGEWMIAPITFYGLDKEGE